MCDLFSSSVLSDSYDSRDCSVTGFSVLSIAQSLLKLTPIELTMPSNQLILCHPLLLLPSIFPSNRVFSKESVLCIRWPKYWTFSFNIIPSNEYAGLISFRIDWFDLLAVEGTLKSLLQHHNSPSVLRCSAFFMVQLSHPYMATRKTISSRGPDKNICKDLSPLLGCQMLNRLRF